MFYAADMAGNEELGTLAVSSQSLESDHSLQIKRLRRGGA